MKCMTTIEKVLILQRLLKELKFRKKAFLDIKEKMYSEIDKNLINFFEGRIYVKKIFDQILNDKTKVNTNEYILIPGDKNSLKNLYEPFYNFLFLLQNDNSLMLKLINLFENDKRYFKPLSEFIVHFLYVDIINCSFNDDRLILLIYLLLEKQIFPDNAKENNNSLKYSKDNILYHIFESMTRKIDIRNFLGNILNKYILKIENLRTNLSLDLNEVNKISNLIGKYLFQRFNSNYSIRENETHPKKKVSTNNLSKDLYSKINIEENPFLKRAKKITLTITKKFGKNIEIIPEKEKNDFDDFEFIDENGKIVELNDLIKKKVEFKKRKTGEKNEKPNDNEKKENKIDFNFEDLKIQKKLKSTPNNNLNKDKNKKKLEFKSFEIFKGKSDFDEKDQNEKNKIIIDIFFQENDITKEKIIKLIDEYNNNNSNNNVNSAMKEYLNNLLKQIDDEKQNKNSEEIFSTSIITEELIVRGANQNEEAFLQLMKNIRINYHIITKTIINIINEISKNASNFPDSIKCIFKMIDILLDKKHNKDNLSYFKNYMFKISFLIGNIIIPILKNPNYNGIISNIISDTTKKNLEIIYNIFDKIVTGQLFNRNNEKKNTSMVLYNKFIIETLPKIFEFVDNLKIDLELPDFINRLVNSIDNKKIHEKNINYNYFKQKPNESIQCQVLCFSLENIYIFGDIIISNKKALIDENENEEQKKILNEIFNNIEKTNDKKGKGENLINFMDEYSDEIKKGTYKYFYFCKILYKTEVENLLKSNSNSIKELNKNDLIKTFKNCLIEILSYENFDYLTEFNNLKASNLNKNKTKDKNIKLKGKNSLKSSLINTLESVDKDDASFKEIIFPKIKNNLIFEMNSDIDNQLIIFCTNYIRLNIDKLDQNYKNNNYSLLFDELILEIKNNIQILNSDILFEHYKKINEAEKINILESKYKSHIKELEKLEYIQYLYNNILLPYEFIIEKNKDDIITNIKYSSKSEIGKIDDMIKKFPDFRKYENEYDNILDIEKNANVPEAIKEYFTAMKTEINNEKFFKKFEEKEKKMIGYDLETYIFDKLYDKLFPTQRSEKDILIYNKCELSSTLEPENFFEKNEVFNETLINEASKYFEKLDEGITPDEKIKIYLKGFQIIKNLITFCTGEEENPSCNDTYPLLIYSMIIAKVKNLPTNVQYIKMYFNENFDDRSPKDLEAILLFIDEMLKIEELNK